MIYIYTYIFTYTMFCMIILRLHALSRPPRLMWRSFWALRSGLVLARCTFQHPGSSNFFIVHLSPHKASITMAE